MSFPPPPPPPLPPNHGFQFPPPPPPPPPSNNQPAATLQLNQRLGEKNQPAGAMVPHPPSPNAVPNDLTNFRPQSQRAGHHASPSLPHPPANPPTPYHHRQPPPSRRDAPPPGMMNQQTFPPFNRQPGIPSQPPPHMIDSFQSGPKSPGAPPSHYLHSSTTGMPSSTIQSHPPHNGLASPIPSVQGLQPPPHERPPPTHVTNQPSLHVPTPPFPHNRPPPSPYRKSPQQGNGPRPPPPQSYQMTQQEQQQNPPANRRTRGLDLSNVPRPPIFTRPHDGQAIPIYNPRRALEQEQPMRLPPPADSRFLVRDDGNASPKLMRASMYAVPANRGIWRHAGLVEMGVVCTPLSIASEDFTPLPPTLPDGSAGEEWRDPQRVPIERSYPPPRCGRCNAYANPFWGLDGKCNFCGGRNRGVDPTSHGTVEYEVKGPYITRPKPVEPVSLYALDATCKDLAAYVSILEHVGERIATHYARQPGESKTKPRIGCALVSSFGIVVASLRNGDLSFSVMSDVSVEPFCPQPIDEWTFDLSSHKGVSLWQKFCRMILSAWKPFLAQLDGKHAHGVSGYATSCGGAALAFLADALKDCGGRGTWMSWRRPNFGVGAIRDREQNKLPKYMSEFSERRLYTPLQLQQKLEGMDGNASMFYKRLGETCARNRVCLDIVMHTTAKPMAFLDVATLGEVCRATTGNFIWIRAPQWHERLRAELCRPLLSYHGVDAVFKVRCSEGIEVKSYFDSSTPGLCVNGGIVGSPELELGNVQPNTTIAVELEHRVGGLPQNTNHIYLQAALLYTTPTGRRRVRVSTLALGKAQAPQDVLRSIDFASTISLMTRRTAAYLRKPSTEDVTLTGARAELVDQLCNILACYRLKSGEAFSAPPGQLLLPSRLQLLPLFISCYNKNVLRASVPRSGASRSSIPTPSADDRAFKLSVTASTSPECAMLFAHPNIFAVDSLKRGEGEWVVPDLSGVRSEMEQTSYHAHIRLPESVNPSIASLKDDKVYVVDDGVAVYCYVGREVSAELRAELIESDVDRGCLISSSSDAGKALQRIVWQLRTFTSVGGGSESIVRPTYPSVIVVISHGSHRDPFDDTIMKLMVDDSMGGERDYSDFLVGVHKMVRKVVDNRSIR